MQIQTGLQIRRHMDCFVDERGRAMPIQELSHGQALNAVRVLSRRLAALEGAAGAIIVGITTIDAAAATATWDGGHVQFSAMEARILGHLAANAGRVVSRESLMLAMYGDRDEPDSADSVLRVAVYRIRSKLRTGAVPLAVQTRHGVGFSLTPALGHPGRGAAAGLAA